MDPRVEAEFDFGKVHTELWTDLREFTGRERFDFDIPATYKYGDYYFPSSLITNRQQAATLVARRLTAIDHFLPHADEKLTAQLISMAAGSVRTAYYHINMEFAAKVYKCYVIRFARATGNQDYMEEFFMQGVLVFRERKETDHLIWLHRYTIDHTEFPSTADASRLWLHQIYDRKGHYRKAYYWLCQLDPDGSFHRARSLIPKYRKKLEKGDSQ
jgi:hypothetical protein